MQDVADFIGFEVPVDRHRIGAQTVRSETCFEECEVIAQERRDAIAFTNA